MPHFADRGAQRLHMLAGVEVATARYTKGIPRLTQASFRSIRVEKLSRPSTTTVAPATIRSTLPGCRCSMLDS